jgi:hypothetical protein
MMATYYETDFYRWAMEQADLLRADRLEEIDVDHLIEEIESMGKSEYRELESRLLVLIQHLLKWQVQPTHRSRSGRLTVREQRRMIPHHLHKNPSLKGRLEEAIEDAYPLARGRASDETDIPERHFPERCPWTFEQLMDPNLFPDP